MGAVDCGLVGGWVLWWGMGEKDPNSLNRFELVLVLSQRARELTNYRTQEAGVGRYTPPKVFLPLRVRDLTVAVTEMESGVLPGWSASSRALE